MRIGSLSHYICRLRALVMPGSLRMGAKSAIKQGGLVDTHRGRVTIGERTKIHKGACVYAQRGGRIDIGSNVSVNPYTILYGSGGITIGNDVRIAAHVVIASFDHRYDDLTKPITSQGITLKPIVIEDDVWIGAGAKVLCGSHLSKGCIIGANAVVKGRTEPYGIYVGSPARLLKYRGQQR